MIIFMQDDPGGDPVKGRYMRLKILIDKFKGHFLIPVNIFPDLGYAETSFIIRPFLPVEARDMRVDEYLLHAGPIWIFSFLILFQVLEDLVGIHYEKTDIPVDLGSRQPDPVAGIHGLP